MKEPIVLIGGLGSHWADYKAGATLLAKVTGRRVFIAGITRFSWMVSSLIDQTVLLDRAHSAITHALKQTDAKKVIIVGHSAGGVVGRGYLADKLAKPRHQPYHGYERVSRLIMVGSPLRAADKPPLHQGMKAVAWVDQNYPGAYFAPQVQYATVSGRYIQGKRDGAWREREAYFNYRHISNDGEQWGDGVVPLSLSELDGAVSLVLDDVAHSPNWGHWFFSEESIIRMWAEYFELGDAPVTYTRQIAA
jgi:pimeloyl-ACP methyl ester carboxylesterase